MDTKDQNYNMHIKHFEVYLAAVIIILVLLLSMTLLIHPVYAVVSHIPNGTWQWAPEGPPTPGGIYWNPWSPTSQMLGTWWNYLPLAVLIHNNNETMFVLAQNVTCSPDNTEIIVNLRPNIYWYVGNSSKIPVTAWDVWTTWIIGGFLFGWEWGYFKNITVVNNYTVIFKLTGSYCNTNEEWRILGYPIQAPYFQFGSYAKEVNTLESKLAVTPRSSPEYSKIRSNLTTLASEIQSLNVTPAVNGFYYPEVNTLSSTNMYWRANPWFLQEFPNSSLKYYPVMITYWTTGNVQSEEYDVGGYSCYDTTAIPQSIVQRMESEGLIVYLAPTYGPVGIFINPTVYPFNITQVRQALAYVINRTMVAEAYPPDYVPVETVTSISNALLPYFASKLPPGFFSKLNNYTYNPTKAAQILESLGFKNINGQWYLPNGTQWTITIIVPSGFTDWVALMQNVAAQLNAFGIKTQVLEISTGTFYSYLFTGHYVVAPFFTGFPTPTTAYNVVGLALSIPPFGTVLRENQTYVFNGKTYSINVTQVVRIMRTLPYSSPEYWSYAAQLIAFQDYWLPDIPLVDKIEPVELNPACANWTVLLSISDPGLRDAMLFPFIAQEFEYMGPVIAFFKGWIVPPGVNLVISPPKPKPSIPTTLIVGIVVVIVIIIIVVGIVLLMRRRRR
ncbi:ABC transporter substrate-binding protein [Vulcanisaeta thermophila]|uniref:ABC transporter substrate-binding protein n=1 Tax=Vulcanisaeta thermophila TaxID=867917 RepID=UPI000B22122F|nr:ABC transporter substrate-binding protein [Vulcanisaeta thermophila]